MARELVCAEGIILKTIPFRESDQILILFTPQGILKVFCKGGRKKKTSPPRFTPLVRVELTYQEGNQEFSVCEDIHVLQFYMAIRQKWDSLQAACDLIKAIQESQVAGKESFKLYQLLLFYLDKIALISNPWILATSFRLKILRHEGLLTHHPIAGMVQFTPQEWEFVQLLAFSQCYHQLLKISLTDDLRAKINLLFNQEMQK
jgi:DNA repair protein RecO (recombination protein O)